MKNKKPKKKKSVKLLFMTLSIALTLLAFNSLSKPVQAITTPSKNLQVDTKMDTAWADTSVYVIVDKKPTFPRGEEKFWNYLATSIKYPEEAKKANIQGKVYVNFIIEKDGSISHVKVLKGIGHGCDKEAVNAVKNMPRWIPGERKRKITAVGGRKAGSRIYADSVNLFMRTHADSFSYAFATRTYLFRTFLMHHPAIFMVNFKWLK